MKKVLLASTALTFAAGMASAQSLEMSGSAATWLDYNSDRGETVQVNTEVVVEFAGSTSTDTGIDLFGTLAIINDQDEPIDDFVFGISGVFGTLTTGNLDHVTDDMGLPDIGIDGIGIDDNAEQFKNATAGSPDVRWDYALNGFTIGAAYGWVGDDSFSVTAGFEQGMFGGKIGYISDGDGAELDFDEDDTVDVTLDANATILVEASVEQGPFAAKGFYSDWNGGFLDSGQGYGVHGSFTAASTTISASWTGSSGQSANPFSDGVGNAYGLGFEYDLGGGAALAGGIGIIETDAADSDGSETVADLGISFSF